mgnify:CR=1 FL=1
MPPAELIERRRQRAAHAWRSDAEALDRAVVLIGAGLPLGLPGGQDQTYEFHVHPDYRWLTGRNEPAGVLAFDPAEGWFDFAPEVTEAERVWEGREPRTVPGARPLGEFSDWIRSRGPRPIASLGGVTDGVVVDVERSRRLGELLVHARRPKDAFEIDLVRRAGVSKFAIQTQTEGGSTP